MEPEIIPPQDSVSRYCRGSSIDEQGRVTGPAFELRESEDSLSVNWIEYLKLNNQDEAIDAIWNILHEKLRVSHTARLAILHVGNTIDHVRELSPDNRMLAVQHQPIEEIDPSHAGINGYSYMERSIAELIAQSVEEDNVFAQE